MQWKCNEIDDCGDQSDENVQNCKGIFCRSTKIAHLIMKLSYHCWAILSKEYPKCELQRYMR